MKQTQEPDTGLMSANIDGVWWQSDNVLAGVLWQSDSVLSKAKSMQSNKGKNSKP